MALCGVTILGSVYVWAVVFALPVNSALNPLLYSYSRIRFSVSYTQKHKHHTYNQFYVFLI